MKIICIGRNYAEHAKELNNPVPASPVFFMKPDTALLKNGEPFYIPDFSNDVHHELEVVLKISKAGKHIDEAFAGNYFDEIGLGIDFTARDLQETAKSKGLPWEIAKAFDGSAPIGKFVSKTTLTDLSAITFHLEVNGTVRQQGNTADLLFSFDRIIAYVSQFVTLKTGDLVFTGTPAGVAAIAIGDRLKGFLGKECLIDCEVK